MRYFRRWMAGPWFFFVLFASVNACLSYSPLPLAGKLWVFLLCFVPLFYSAFHHPSPGARGPDASIPDTIPSFRPWLWFILAALALYLRFFKLETLSTWPIVDEGRTSLFAIRQAAHWDWKLLYGYNQLPPFYYWAFALFFKLFQPSLATLWLFPALLSTLILLGGWAAARLLLSRSLSFLAACLLAFSFWPLYAGRFAAEGLLVLFWEVMGFLWMGILWKIPSGNRKKAWAGWMGIWVGAGFYVHLHWPFIAIMLAMPVVFHLMVTGKSRHRDWVALALFSLGAVLVPLPLLKAVGDSSYGDYLYGLYAFQGDHFKFGDYLGNSFSYLTSLFWGVDVPYFAYKPIWGGFLNPLLGSFFFLGLMALVKNRKKPLNAWLLLSFAVFLFPAFLTNNLETFRVIQVLPPLLVVTAAGLRNFLESLNLNRRVLFLALLLPASLGLDLYHLTGPYARFWTSHPDQWSRNFKSFRFWKTYLFLEPLAKAKGPGALLFESSFDPHDQTLLAATYSFNASGNPALPLDSVRWVALLQGDDLQDYLSRLFPRSQLQPLDLFAENLFSSLQWVHGVGLRLVEVDPGNRALLIHWIEADRWLEEAAVGDLNLPGNQPHSTIIENLSGHYKAFQGDPYLESLFFERLAGYAQEDGDDLQALRFTQQALARGIPRASAYHRLGVLWVKNRNFLKARKAFVQAGNSNPAFKPPPALLQRLSLGKP